MAVVWQWETIWPLVASFKKQIASFLAALVFWIFRRLVTFLRPTATIIIEEHDASASPSDLYDAAQTYLGFHCLASAPVVTLYKPRNSAHPVPSLPPSHTACDSFHGIPLRWTSRAVETPSSSSPHRSLELSFHRRHRNAVHSLYLPYVFDEAVRLRHKAHERRLYTNCPAAQGDDHHRLWSSVPFAHPATFDTLAIDPALRDDIRSDLLRFVGRRDHYARVGRAWKRAYLLHGPPGTGKTSLVAAIANLLEFDVYDLQLTTVPSNSHLRHLLVSTTPKSVVAVLDVDCFLDLSDRNRNKDAPQPELDQTPSWATSAGLWSASRYGGMGVVSLSAVLNFVDGLWSSCVGEQLVIFTTNHPERLEPALLRPGQMDRSIHLSYCGPAAFRVLAKNYLELGAKELEELMAEAEALLLEVQMTPVDIAKVFMGCNCDRTDAVVRKVVEEMRRRKALVLASRSPWTSDGEVSGREDRKSEFRPPTIRRAGNWLGKARSPSPGPTTG
ncbi:AAA-ATPase At3g50940 [Elaeis guineensis]|uniref:AAA-ATPase At3g50940 n=1 Tax=Elaeis guineensis var. tenera TaxID=51953 RepID=UPI003C6D4DAE